MRTQENSQNSGTHRLVHSVRHGRQLHVATYTELSTAKMRPSPKTSRARGVISLLCLHSRALPIGRDKRGMSRVRLDKIGNTLCERRG